MCKDRNVERVEKTQTAKVSKCDWYEFQNKFY